jgi:hypothetical protein
VTKEEKLEIIKSYIDDIKTFENNPDWPIYKKQHIKRALKEYNNLYEEVQNGRMDPDFLHENITSFVYMLQ